MNNKNKLDEVTEGGENVPVAQPAPAIPMAVIVNEPEKPKTEKPKTEKPKTEKPKTEKPKTEKPKRAAKSEDEDEVDPDAIHTVPQESFEKAKRIVSKSLSRLKEKLDFAVRNNKSDDEVSQLKAQIAEHDDLMHRFNNSAPTTAKQIAADNARLSPVVILIAATGAPLVVAALMFFALSYKFGRADSEIENQFAALKDKEITTLRKSLAEQKELIAEIKQQTAGGRSGPAGLDESTKKELLTAIGNSGNETAPGFRKVVNQLTELSKKITNALANSTGLPPEAVEAMKKFSEDAGKLNFDPLTKAVKELEKEKDALAKEKDALAKEKESLVKFREAAQADARKPLDAATAKLEAALKAAGRQTEGPRDIWLVGMDSPRLAMANFRKEFNETIGKVAREPNAPRRAGLALARSSSLTVIAKPDDPAKLDLDKLGQPTQGTGVPGVEETPAEFGLALLKGFDGKRSNAQNRVILFGSAECPPLTKATPGWQDMSEIHVVLLQTEGGTQASRAAALDRLLKWQEFCLDRQGTLTVIPAAEENKSAKVQAVLDRLMK